MSWKEDRQNITNYDYNQMHQQNGPPPPAYAPQYQPQPLPPPPVTMVSAPTTNVVVANCFGPTVRYVPDYMAWSILNMLFCCLPLGIAATVFSCMARDQRWAGDTESARRNGRVALGLNAAATISGVLLIIGMIIWAVTATNRAINEEVNNLNSYNDVWQPETTTHYWGK